jgi:hypothetical protein
LSKAIAERISYLVMLLGSGSPRVLRGCRINGFISWVGSISVSLAPEIKGIWRLFTCGCEAAVAGYVCYVAAGVCFIISRYYITQINY